jgi:hypothetical protein
MSDKPTEVDDLDDEAPTLEFEVMGVCDACGNEQVIIIYSLTGEALDACGTVCPCGEVAWIVRFAAHPDAKWSSVKGLNETN